MGYTQVTIEERCLPAYVPRAPRSGKSLQVWIARHRRLLGMANASRPWATGRRTRRSSPARVAGPVPGWSSLRACVLERLRWGWSPEQVCGQLARGLHLLREHLPVHLRPESAAQRPRLEAYLPEAKWKRGRRVRQRSSSVSFILGVTRSPSARPLLQTGRRHWEADLMQFGRSGAVVLVARTALAPDDGRPAAFEGSRAGREGHGAPPGAVAAGVPADDVRQRGVRAAS